MGSLTVVEQQLDELGTLHQEAHESRYGLTVDAILRVQANILRGIPPNRDDAALVQQFIGKRIAQNRYGKSA